MAKIVTHVEEITTIDYEIECDCGKKLTGLIEGWSDLRECYSCGRVHKIALRTELIVKVYELKDEKMPDMR